MGAALLVALAVSVPSLRITDTSQGCGGGSSQIETLQRDSRVFTSGSRSVSSSLVDHLRSVLRTSRSTQTLDLAALGVTPESVAAHRATMLHAGRLSPSTTLSPMFEKQLGYDNVALVAQNRATGYPASTTMVEVTVALDGPGAFSVSSVSESPMRLPWVVKMGGATWKTFSPEVPRAIAKIRTTVASKPLVDDMDYWPDGFWRDAYEWGASFDRAKRSDEGLALARTIDGWSAATTRFSIESARIMSGER